MNTHRQRGFTLMEMVIALAIFALIALAGQQMLQGVMRSQQAAQQHGSQLTESLRLFSLLEQDLQHALIPALAVSQAAPAAQFQAADSGEILQLTRRHRPSPESPRRSPLQRVSWQLTSSGLERRDQETGTLTARFSAVQQVRLRFWSAGRWQSRWQAGFSLPEAIEITLEMREPGPLQRVFMLYPEAG